MDQVLIQLGVGLGLQNVVGWFVPILHGMLNILPVLLALFFYADKSSEYNNGLDRERYGVEGKDVEYDFIVVGGGSAGSVVSNRLSAHFKVLLLERGGEPNPLTTVPGLQPALVSRAETDYGYLTVPQNSSCLAMKNRQTIWNAGKGLGGSSMINGMVFIRGHPFDYDRWSKVTKDERWSYKNLLPYFLRSEGYCHSCDPTEGIKPTINSKYHNSKGEVTLRPLALTPLASEFLEAQKWGGVDRGDVNAPYYKPIADTITGTLNRGRRMSAYHAFIAPIMAKRSSSLTVIKYAQVVEILFKDGTNQAIGVKFERFGKLEVAKASKEVILSAGAVITPKLLMLSGIGPAEDLEELNIPLRCNLPVGRNLQDHIDSSLGPILIDTPGPPPPPNETDVNSFLQNGTGPLSIPPLRAMALWLSSRALKFGEDKWPDIHVVMSSSPISPATITNYERNYNMRRDILEEFLQPVMGQHAINLPFSFGRAISRGVIKLKSSHFTDDPLIDPRYYSDPQNTDIGVMVEAVQRLLYLVENAPSYRRIGARLSPIPFPSCRKLPFRSDKYWECYIRHFSLTRHHYTSTASMGAADSPNSVVDPELKVIGAKGLRVIDASIMPHVVTTNTNAATLMIGERGSDFILSEYYKTV